MTALISTVSITFSLSEAGTLIFAALLICWVSAVLSAFIDNIPYVAVSIPLIHQLIPTLSGETEVVWWALSLGVRLGGNATVVGASLFLVGFVLLGSTAIHFVTWPLAIVLVAYDYFRGRRTFRHA